MYLQMQLLVDIINNYSQLILQLEEKDRCMGVLFGKL